MSSNQTSKDDYSETVIYCQHKIVRRANGSNSERFLENEQSKTTDKEACFVKTFLCSIFYVAKFDITDIIIVHPLAKKKRQIM